jgi:hypothetical protein
MPLTSPESGRKELQEKDKQNHQRVHDSSNLER